MSLILFSYSLLRTVGTGLLLAKPLAPACCLPNRWHRPVACQIVGTGLLLAKSQKSIITFGSVKISPPKVRLLQFETNSLGSRYEVMSIKKSLRHIATVVGLE